MSTDSAAVRELGRELANALDESDIVGRWMSHHLAELITQSEANPDNDELAATTRDVVLKLWEHKAGAPFHKTPYTYLQPVLHALARLEPKTDPWAYYSPFSGKAPSATTLSTYPLLQKACDIDREVGNLIRLAIGITAREAISCEEPWVIAGVKLAQNEEDSAVRTLERLMRRIQSEADSDALIPLEPDDLRDEHSDHSRSAGPVGAGTITSMPTTADADADDDHDASGDIDSLAIALRNAILRCQRLIDQFDNLRADKGVGASEEKNSK